METGSLARRAAPPLDRDFDYRYSVLPYVFASLLRDGRLTEDDLLGLAPDKLDAIRHIARS